MSINWIKITDRAREGINIINFLPFDIFITVLNYVHKQMHCSKKIINENDTNVESENTLEELERLVGVPRTEFLLLIKTFSYILRRISTFVLKPTRLTTELQEKLQLQDEAKIEAIVKLWVRQTAPLMRNLADPIYKSNQIDDVAWKLNVEISSQCQQRDKTARAVLQLKTGLGEDLNLEMDYEGLLKLYNQFEAIQTELDSMKT